MALVFAAIVPHSPLLLPSIGKEHRELFRQTIPALERLAEELYAAGPDVLVIVTPHAPALPTALSFTVGLTLQTSFRDFGDLATRETFAGHPGFGQHLRELLELKVSIVLRERQELDYGASVPLHLIAEKLRAKTRVLPVGCAGLALADHFAFGRFLQAELLNARERIGVLASADLSRRLVGQKPSESVPEAKTLDERLLRIVRERSTEELLRLPPKLLQAAGACGVRPIATLFGVLNSMNATPEILAFEAPFGVGELTALFRLA